MRGVVVTQNYIPPINRAILSSIFNSQFSVLSKISDKGGPAAAELTLVNILKYLYTGCFFTGHPLKC